MDKDMSSSVTLENEIIYNRVEGNQDYETVSENTRQLKELSESLKKANKRVLILVDLTQLGIQNSDARRAAMESLKSFDYDKMAIYSKGVFLKYVTQFVVRATGVDGKVQHFTEVDEAKRWLTS